MNITIVRIRNATVYSVYNVLNTYYLDTEIFYICAYMYELTIYHMLNDSRNVRYLPACRAMESRGLLLLIRLLYLKYNNNLAV